MKFWGKPNSFNLTQLKLGSSKILNMREQWFYIGYEVICFLLSKADGSFYFTLKHLNVNTSFECWWGLVLRNYSLAFPDANR